MGYKSPAAAKGRCASPAIGPAGDVQAAALNMHTRIAQPRRQQIRIVRMGLYGQPTVDLSLRKDDMPAAFAPG